MVVATLIIVGFLTVSALVFWVAIPRPAKSTKVSRIPSVNKAMHQSINDVTQHLQGFSSADLKSMKSSLVTTAPSSGSSEKYMDELTRQIDELIEKAEAHEQYQEQQKQAEIEAAKDDICPECGKTFAVRDDYICEDCRALVDSR